MTPANLLRDQAILRQLLLQRVQAGTGAKVTAPNTTVDVMAVGI